MNTRVHFSADVKSRTVLVSGARLNVRQFDFENSSILQIDELEIENGGFRELPIHEVL
jgi:hypothetical protein